VPQDSRQTKGTKVLQLELYSVLAFLLEKEKKNSVLAWLIQVINEATLEPYGPKASIIS
jgi:hypothetical protein